MVLVTFFDEVNVDIDITNFNDFPEATDDTIIVSEDNYTSAVGTTLNQYYTVYDITDANPANWIDEILKPGTAPGAGVSDYDPNIAGSDQLRIVSVSGNTYTSDGTYSYDANTGVAKTGQLIVDWVSGEIAKIQYSTDGKFDSLAAGNVLDGRDSFTYTINDLDGLDSTATVTVEITGEADAPRINEFIPDLNLTQFAFGTYTLTDTDGDNDPNTDADVALTLNTTPIDNYNGVTLEIADFFGTVDSTNAVNNKYILESGAPSWVQMVDENLGILSFTHSDYDTDFTTQTITIRMVQDAGEPSEIFESLSFNITLLDASLFSINDDVVELGNYSRTQLNSIASPNADDDSNPLTKPPIGTYTLNAGAGDDNVTLIADDVSFRDPNDNTADDLSVFNSSNTVIVVGGEGSDTITGLDRSDSISGDIAVDNDLSNKTFDDDASLSGGAGGDTIRGDAVTARISNSVATITFGNDSIDGGDAADFLYGDAENVGILGTGTLTLIAGDDTIIGGTGGDTIYGDWNNKNPGTGAIIASGGNDYIDGGSGDDTIIAGIGDDIIIGGLGNNTLTGGEGIDTVAYSNYTVQAVTVNLASTQAFSTDVSSIIDDITEVENIQGSAFNDNDITTIDDRLTGDDNDNVIEGMQGSDEIDGAGGNDTASYQNSDASVTVTINNTDPNTNVGGHAEGDQLSNIENLIGSAFDDTLIGDDGDNTIAGLDGENTLDGGLGVDTLDYSTGTSLNIDLSAGTATNNGYGKEDTIIASSDVLQDVGSSFENIIATSSDDTITADVDDNTIIAGAGVDTITTLGGDDTIDAGEGGDILYAGAGSDVIRAGLGDDTIDGDRDSASIDNSDSSDVDVLDYSSDTVGIDINLTLGTQQSDGSGSEADGDIIALADVGDSTIESIVGGSGVDTITGDDDDNLIEGNGGDDFIDGGAGNDVLRGGDGDDELTGGAGDDIIRGDAGNDKLTGGDGNDTLSYELSTSTVTYNDATTNYFGNNQADKLIGVLIDLDDNTNNQGDAGGDTYFDNFESIIATDNDDILLGDTNDNLFDGGAGADYIDGGAGGFDTVTYQRAGGTVIINLADGQPESNSDASGDTLNNIDYVIGSNSTNASVTTGDTFIGNIDNNQFEGLAGADRFYGNQGNNTLSYALDTVGIDVDLTKTVTLVEFTFGVASLTGKIQGGDTDSHSYNDIIVEDIEGAGLAGASFENVLGGSGDDTITGDIDNNILYGNDGIDTLTAIANSDGSGDTLYGGADSDTLYGSTAGDNLFGGSGSDTLYGGDGEDTLEGNEGADTLEGGDANDIIYGNEGNDTLKGDAGDDQLYGGDDNDVLFGGLGDDILDGEDGDFSELYGGKGNDTIVGRAGRDTISGDIKQFLNANSTFLAETDTGIDTVDYSNDSEGINIDLRKEAAQDDSNPLSLSSGDVIELASLGADNRPTALDDNDSTIERVIGGSGDDYIQGDADDNFFIGNGGRDEFYGGDGFDTVDYSESTADETIDLTDSSNNHRASDNDFIDSSTIEQIITGTGDDTLTGDANNNTFDAGTGINIIDLGAGDDTIIGTVDAATDDYTFGLGSDTLDFSRSDFGLTFDFDETTNKQVTYVDGSTNTQTAATVANSDTPENIIASMFDDTINITDSDFNLSIFTTNTIDAGDGDDTLNITFANATSGIVIDTNFASRFTNIETINLADGDTIVDFGKSLGSNVTLNAGVGNDTFNLTNTVTLNKYEIDLSGTSKTVTELDNSDASIDVTTIEGFEKFDIVNSTASTKFIGDADDNTIEASTSADTEVIGGDGNDTYIVGDLSGLINQSFDGGNGVDTIDFSNVTLTDKHLTLEYSAMQLTDNIDLISVENIIVNSDTNITVTGNTDDNTLTYTGSGVTSDNLISEIETVFGTDGGDEITISDQIFGINLYANTIDDAGYGTQAYSNSATATDTLTTGDGDDNLYAGVNDTILTGGDGKDTFHFYTVGSMAHGSHTITDFTLDDVIDISKVNGSTDVTADMIDVSVDNDKFGATLTIYSDASSMNQILSIRLESNDELTEGIILSRLDNGSLDGTGDFDVLPGNLANSQKKIKEDDGFNGRTQSLNLLEGLADDAVIKKIEFVNSNDYTRLFEQGFELDIFDNEIGVIFDNATALFNRLDDSFRTINGTTTVENPIILEVEVTVGQEFNPDLTDRSYNFTIEVFGEEEGTATVNEITVGTQYSLDFGSADGPASLIGGSTLDTLNKAIDTNSIRYFTDSGFTNEIIDDNVLTLNNDKGASFNLQVITANGKKVIELTENNPQMNGAIKDVQLYIQYDVIDDDDTNGVSDPQAPEYTARRSANFSFDRDEKDGYSLDTRAYENYFGVYETLPAGVTIPVALDPNSPLSFTYEFKTLDISDAQGTSRLRNPDGSLDYSKITQTIRFNNDTFGTTVTPNAEGIVSFTIGGSAILETVEHTVSYFDDYGELTTLSKTFDATPGVFAPIDEDDPNDIFEGILFRLYDSSSNFIGGGIQLPSGLFNTPKSNPTEPALRDEELFRQFDNDLVSTIDNSALTRSVGDNFVSIGNQPSDNNFGDNDPASGITINIEAEINTRFLDGNEISGFNLNDNLTGANPGKQITDNDGNQVTLDGDDIIIGGAGYDVINGLGGDDVLYAEINPDSNTLPQYNDTDASNFDLLVGGAGDDTLVTGSVDTLMWGDDGTNINGSVGEDNFVLLYNGNALTPGKLPEHGIYDFVSGTDIIDVRDVVESVTFSNFTYSVTDNSGNALITLNDSGAAVMTLTLFGVNSATISDSDFIFIDNTAAPELEAGPAQSTDVTDNTGSSTINLFDGVVDTDNTTAGVQDADGQTVTIVDGSLTTSLDATIQALVDSTGIDISDAYTLNIVDGKLVSVDVDTDNALFDGLAEGEVASFTFNYTLTDSSDANALFTEHTHTVNITGENDAPELNEDGYIDFVPVAVDSTPGAGGTNTFDAAKFFDNDFDVDNNSTFDVSRVKLFTDAALTNEITSTPVATAWGDISFDGTQITVNANTGTADTFDFFYYEYTDEFGATDSYLARVKIVQAATPAGELRIKPAIDGTTPILTFDIENFDSVEGLTGLYDENGQLDTSKLTIDWDYTGSAAYTDETSATFAINNNDNFDATLVVSFTTDAGNTYSFSSSNTAYIRYDGSAPVATAGNDVIVTNTAITTLDGGLGNDIIMVDTTNSSGNALVTLSGGEGDDTFVIQDGARPDGLLIDGGIGNDTVDYSYSSINNAFNNLGNGAVPPGPGVIRIGYTEVENISGSNSLTGTERLYGTDGDSIIIGNDGAGEVYGSINPSDGNDIIYTHTIEGFGVEAFDPDPFQKSTYYVKAGDGADQVFIGNSIVNINEQTVRVSSDDVYHFYTVKGQEFPIDRFHTFDMYLRRADSDKPIIDLSAVYKGDGFAVNTTLIDYDSTMLEVISDGKVSLRIRGDEFSIDKDVNVKLSNAPIVVADEPVTTNEDTSVVIDVLANDVDPDGDVLLVQNATADNGQVTINEDNTLTYTPNADYSGNDTITYQVTDGRSFGAFNTEVDASVAVTVNAVNDAPDAVDDNLGSFTANNPITINVGDLTSNDSDAEDITVQFNNIEGNGVNGTIVNNNDGTLTFTPDANFTGDASFQYTVIDSSSEVSLPATVTLTIPNTPPTVTAVTASATEDDANFSVNLLTGASDINGDSLSATNVTYTSGDNSGVTINGDSLDVDFNDYQYLANGQSETIVYNYDISDGTDTTANTATITINGANDAAEFSGVLTGTVTEEGTQDAYGDANHTDVDGTDADDLFIEVDIASSTLTAGGYGIYSVTTDGNWSYFLDNNDSRLSTLNSGQSVDDTFTILADDGTEQVITITINGADNRAPKAEDDFVNMSEHATSLDIDALANDSDPDGDEITVDSIGPVYVLGMVTADTVTFDSVTKLFTFEPAASSNYSILEPGQFAQVTFDYTITDGNGGFNTAYVSIAIAGEQEPPVANPDNGAGFTTGEDDGIFGPFTTANVLTNDSDPEDNTITITGADATSAAGVNITNIGDGTFQYQLGSQFDSLAAGEQGFDTFDYFISDGEGGAATGTVTMTINGVNDAAVIGGVLTGSVTEDATLIASGDASHTDVDGTDDSFIAQLSTLSSDNGYGTYTVTAAGVWTYELNNNDSRLSTLNSGQSVNDTFTIQAEDGTAQLITITINGEDELNIAPVAGDDSGAGFETNDNADTFTTTVSVLDNDTDADVADVLSVDSVVGGASAAGVTVINNNDGTFDYQLGSQFDYLTVGQSATDTFDYVVSDGNGGTDTGTVTITIDGANDAPTVTAVTVDANEDALNFSVNLLTGSSDVDLTFALDATDITPTSGDGSGVTINGNSLDVDISAYQYLAASETETIEYSFNVSDGMASVANTATITINGANDGASITSDIITGELTEDDTLFTTSGRFSVSDIDNGEAIYATPASLSGTYGNFQLAALPESSPYDYEWTYTLDNSRAATDALTDGQQVTDQLVIDSLDGTASITVGVTINGNTKVEDVGTLVEVDVDNFDNSGMTTLLRSTDIVNSGATSSLGAFSADNFEFYLDSNYTNQLTIEEGWQNLDFVDAQVIAGTGGSNVLELQHDLAANQLGYQYIYYRHVYDNGDIARGEIKLTTVDNSITAPTVIHSMVATNQNSGNFNNIKLTSVVEDVIDSRPTLHLRNPDGSINQNEFKFSYHTSYGDGAQTVGAPLEINDDLRSVQLTNITYNDIFSYASFDNDLGDPIGGLDRNLSTDTINRQVISRNGAEFKADSPSSLSNALEDRLIILGDGAGNYFGTNLVSETVLFTGFSDNGRTINTGDGDDTIIISRGQDHNINAGAGSDTIDLSQNGWGGGMYASLGDPFPNGDVFLLSNGAYFATLALLNNSVENIIGSYGNDTFNGRNNEDNLLRGGLGDDILRGIGGNNSLYGDGGNDDVFGGTGNDTIYGGSGQDDLFGADGNDIMYGNDEATFGIADFNNNGLKDSIFGGAGNDHIYIGDYNTDIYGDETSPVVGADTFYFYSLGDSGHGFHIIRDFNGAEGDKLNLYQLGTLGTELTVTYSLGNTNLEFNTSTTTTISLRGFIYDEEDILSFTDGNIKFSGNDYAQSTYVIEKDVDVSGDTIISLAQELNNEFNNNFVNFTTGTFEIFADTSYTTPLLSGDDPEQMGIVTAELKGANLILSHDLAANKLGYQTLYYKYTHEDGNELRGQIDLTTTYNSYTSPTVKHSMVAFNQGNSSGANNIKLTSVVEDVFYSRPTLHLRNEDGTFNSDLFKFDYYTDFANHYASYYAENVNSIQLTNTVYDNIFSYAQFQDDQNITRGGFTGNKADAASVDVRVINGAEYRVGSTVTKSGDFEGRLVILAGGTNLYDTKAGSDKGETVLLTDYYRTGTTINTGGGDDTIILSRGSGHIVNAGSGSDTVDLSQNGWGGGMRVFLSNGSNNNINIDLYNGNSYAANLAALQNNSVENIIGSYGNDNIGGKDGVENILDGAGGDDFIWGYGGADTLYGGSGNDTIYAAQSTTINTVNDDDTIYGGAGNDTLIGDLGNDTISGDSGSDTISGHGGNDILHANNEAKFNVAAFIGNGDPDTIDGGAGDDHIYIGDRETVLTGGTGADTFHFYTVANDTHGNHVVTDFNLGEGDKLNVDNFGNAAAQLNVTNDGTDTTITRDGVADTAITLLNRVYTSSDDIFS